MGRVVGTSEAESSRDSALGRLSRRGKVTITAEDGSYEVSFKASGPYRGRGWCTIDEADLWNHCHLGATNWHGEGTDVRALIATCEEETRPRQRDVDDLVWEIEYRRHSRTHGPPLPSYRRWHGWRPETERWLRTFSHQHEHLGGYERDVKEAQQFEADALARAR
jgi:hypothetical protein